MNQRHLKRSLNGGESNHHVEMRNRRVTKEHNKKNDVCGDTIYIHQERFYVINYFFGFKI